VEHAKNLVWEKVIVGKDKTEAAKQYMLKSNSHKEYCGLILTLTSP
jgi:hypothetical protein